MDDAIVLTQIECIFLGEINKIGGFYQAIVTTYEIDSYFRRGKLRYQVRQTRQALSTMQFSVARLCRLLEEEVEHQFNNAACQGKVED